VARSFSSLVLTLLLAAPGFIAAGDLRVGFAEKDITPEVDAGKPAVWLAGYSFGRKATGVHDPLLARAVVLVDGREKIALASVDLVGLQYDAVQQIRASLEGYRHITVASTHNHEGPDVIGIWGPTPFQRGVSDAYLKLVVERVVAAIREAEKNVAPASAFYGTAEDETLLDDNRKPEAKDGVLRVLKFTGSQDRVAGLIVQWNSHPEAMSSKNTLVTADFPAATVDWLKKKYDCPVVYLSGAVGGLMAPPDNRIKNDAGEVLGDGSFEYTRRLGEETARLASRAVDAATPIQLTPLDAAVKQIALPVDNKIYRLARQAGVLTREGRVWTGDPDKLGNVIDDKKPGGEMAIVTEVSCLRLGELTIFNVPGELYPELVYGKFQEPVDPAADFPAAALEPTAVSLAPSGKWLLIGLACDEVGYIIPKRQWDEAQPFCYGRAKSQYGEVNSCGPETAPILMKSLADCARQLQGKR
jgi:hypothetical protein